ncbi:MAG: tRNA lysidine(34) synthetase TilS [Candidatus Cryptobacteroides sp.]
MQNSFDSFISGLEDCRKVLLAVSGGVDSMVMAELFLNSSCHIPFDVAHCNFHLRGKESDSDETLVRQWCTSNGIDFLKKDFATSEYASTQGVSIEMAARTLRYEWFAELCRERGYSFVAVAHNANDNAETFLLNLLRGTGIKGLTGMKPVSTVPVPQSEARLLRPLLGFTRDDILEYAAACAVLWHEDVTNSDTAFKRNCIRQEVFPLFAKLNPSFLGTLSGNMARLSQEQSAADRQFVLESARVLSEPGPGELLRIDVLKLRNMPDPAWLLFRLLEPYGFPPSAAAGLCRLISREGTFSGRVFNSDGFRAVTSGNSILVTPLAEALPSRETVVTGEGEYSLAGKRFSVRIADWKQGMSLRPAAGTLMFDSAALKFPFTVRLWEKGDWLCPLGLKNSAGRSGRKKISDLFVDLGYSLPDKESACVLLPSDGDSAPGRVAALLWERIDEAFKVTEKTASVVLVERRP